MFKYNVEAANKIGILNKAVKWIRAVGASVLQNCKGAKDSIKLLNTIMFCRNFSSKSRTFKDLKVRRKR